MAEMTVIEAVRSALREEMERDESVFVMGEDIAGGAGGGGPAPASAASRWAGGWTGMG